MSEEPGAAGHARARWQYVGTLGVYYSIFLASWIFATQTDGWISGAVGTGGGLFFTAAVALAWIGTVKVALARRGAPAPPP